jgi:hypothetical protein
MPGKFNLYKLDKLFKKKKLCFHAQGIVSFTRLPDFLFLLRLLHIIHSSYIKREKY